MARSIGALLPAGYAREMMAVYRRNQDLINIGAYPAGSSAPIDRAIHYHEPLRQFLRQGVREGFTSAESWEMLGKTMTPPVRPAPASPPPPPPQKRA